MRYNTIREAAVAGLAIAIPKSFKEKFEYGGVIRKDESGYWPDDLKTDGDPTSVSFNVEELADSEQIVGAFHTHVMFKYNLWTDLFSGQDVFMSALINKPHYLGDAETGDVYELANPRYSFVFDMVTKEYKGEKFSTYKGKKFATVAKEAA